METYIPEFALNDIVHRERRARCIRVNRRVPARLNATCNTELTLEPATKYRFLKSGEETTTPEPSGYLYHAHYPDEPYHWSDEYDPRDEYYRDDWKYPPWSTIAKKKKKVRWNDVNECRYFNYMASQKYRPQFSAPSGEIDRLLDYILEEDGCRRKDTSSSDNGYPDKHACLHFRRNERVCESDSLGSVAEKPETATVSTQVERVGTTSKTVQLEKNSTDHLSSCKIKFRRKGRGLTSSISVCFRKLANALRGRQRNSAASEPLVERYVVRLVNPDREILMYDVKPTFLQCLRECVVN